MDPGCEAEPETLMESVQAEYVGKTRRVRAMTSRDSSDPTGPTSLHTLHNNSYQYKPLQMSTRANIPSLRDIPLANVRTLETPGLKIKTDHDVEIWRTTRSYQDYAIFLRRLNEAVSGKFLPWSPPNPSQVCCFVFRAYSQLYLSRAGDYENGSPPGNIRHLD